MKKFYLSCILGLGFLTFATASEGAFPETSSNANSSTTAFQWGSRLGDKTEEPASSDEESSANDMNSDNTEKKNMPSRFTIGGDYTRVHFTPHGTPSFNGNLGGAQAMYEYRPNNDIYAALKGNWKQGSMHGSPGKRSLIFIDVQERLGYTFTSCNDDFMFTFYSGFAYRYLSHKLTPTEGSSVSFRYNELYVPVGFLMDYQVNWWFNIGLDFTWMPQVYPTVSIVPLKGARWILSNQIANCYVDIPFDFTLTKCNNYHLVFDPFFEYWQDGHSTAETSFGVPLGLPHNTYLFYGIDVNFVFHF